MTEDQAKKLLSLIETYGYSYYMDGPYEDGTSNCTLNALGDVKEYIDFLTEKVPVFLKSSKNN